MERYECDRCGACCQGHLIVEAYQLDVLREPRLAQAEPARAHLSVPEVLDDLDDEYRCLLIAGNRPCCFLSATNLCSIYPTRPNGCVAMQPGDEQCQRARDAAGLLPLLPVDRPDSSVVLEQGQQTPS